MSMETADALEQGRACFERQAWRDAHERLSAAAAERPLQPEDLDRLAACAFMLGSDAECESLRERAYHDFHARGDIELAAQSAFWLGFELLTKGSIAQGRGWLGRARRLLDDAGLESVIRGYLLLPEGIGSIRDDPSRSYALFSEALDVGKRFRDVNLISVARMGQGRSLIKMQRTAEGIALLDESTPGQRPCRPGPTEARRDRAAASAPAHWPADTRPRPCRTRREGGAAHRADSWRTRPTASAEVR